jgi:hypothetical protein
MGPSVWQQPTFQHTLAPVGLHPRCPWRTWLWLLAGDFLSAADTWPGSVVRCAATWANLMARCALSPGRRWCRPACGLSLEHAKNHTKIASRGPLVALRSIPWDWGPGPNSG